MQALMQPLTAKQQEMANFIENYHQQHGGAPTYQEIADHFRFRSVNAVTKHLKALRQKGRLESDSGKTRSLRVVSALTKHRSRIVEIPIYGTIPAGIPEANDQEVEGCVRVDMDSIGFKSMKPLRNAIAIRVSGDSMIGKQICNGDIVILEFGPDPRDGEVVAAYIDGKSTLKTFHIKNGKPYLKAENPKYSDIRPLEELAIQGVFRALIRKAKD